MHASPENPPDRSSLLNTAGGIKTPAQRVGIRARGVTGPRVTYFTAVVDFDTVDGHIPQSA
ncbi:MAG TPA: hypothetical protein VMU34_16585 [Mycobacterium sp.]|nr:hypothetical protein [Mycobacterium sp.]